MWHEAAHITILKLKYFSDAQATMQDNRLRNWQCPYLSLLLEAKLVSETLFGKIYWQF
jgi:hypothetical protein